MCFGRSFRVAVLMTAGVVVRGPFCLPYSGAASAAPSDVIAPAEPSLVADFDGDLQPDYAALTGNGGQKRLQLRLSSSHRINLSFASGTNDPGVLLAADIDDDGDLDLIWISPAQPSLPAVWLGDGRGHFELSSKSADAFKTSSLVRGTSGPELVRGAGRTQPACLSVSFCFVVTPDRLEIGFQRPPSPVVCFEPCPSRTLRLNGVYKRGPPENLSQVYGLAPGTPGCV